MQGRSCADRSIAAIMTDPMIRPIMDSDHVTDEAMVALLSLLRQIMAEREGGSVQPVRVVASEG